jgi:hypothetical protein
MAHVYQNVIIGNRLDVSPTGHVITTAKAQLVTDNGTQTTVQPVPTLDAQFLASDATTSTGLVWRKLTPADVGIIAGNGLTQVGNTIDVGGSTTIFANPDNVIVNSSAIANQVLLSAGTVGTEAVYGAVPLNNAASVTGTLPFANGGTGATTFANGNRLVATNVGNTALVATAINPDDITPTTATLTTANATPTSILTIPTVSGSSYVVRATFLARGTTAPFATASFTVGATFNNVSGTLTLAGASNDLVYVPLGTTWFAEAAVSGTNINLLVTGDSTLSVNWKVRVEPLVVLP